MNLIYKNITGTFEVEGQGPAVVWLHGFMENIKVWKHQRSFFKPHRTNIYIDLLGHGETSNLEETHTMKAQAAWVKYVLDTLEISNCAIIGHSMGGYVGLAFLEAYPDMVSHFVLLNSTSNADSEEKKINRDRAIKIVIDQKDSFLRMGVVNLFGEAQRNKLQHEIDILLEDLSGISAKGIIAALRGMKERKNQKTLLTNFTGKKLMVIGENDPVLNVEKSKSEALVTGSETLILEGGHMSYLEATKKLNTFLLDFLT